MIRKLWTWVFLFAVWAPLTLAEDADGIIAKHLEARGGLDKIRSVDSARMTGKLVIGGGDMEAPFVRQWKRPNKLRLEFTLQGMTGIQAFDGETAWQVMPFQGKTEPEAVSDEQKKLREEQADFDGPFIDSQKKGYTVEYLGEEEIEGTPAHKFKTINKHGDVSYHFLDAEYFLEIKTEGKRTIRGTEIEFEVSHGDYKEVEGLMVAHSVESKPKGAPAGQTFLYEKIELNIDLPDSQFVMPEEVEESEDEEEEAESEE